jgi:hypothetical protein
MSLHDWTIVLTEKSRTLIRTYVELPLRSSLTTYSGPMRQDSLLVSLEQRGEGGVGLVTLALWCQLGFHIQTELVVAPCDGELEADASMLGAVLREHARVALDARLVYERRAAFAKRIESMLLVIQLHPGSLDDPLQPIHPRCKGGAGGLRCPRRIHVDGTAKAVQAVTLARPGRALEGRRGNSFHVVLEH